MNRVKAIAISVIALGFYYLALDAEVYLRNRKFMEFLTSGSTEAEVELIMSSSGYVALINTCLALIIVGLITLIVGFGLYKSREWARKAWLGIGVVLICFHLLIMIDYYTRLDMRRWFELMFVTLLSSISWAVLMRRNTKNLFR